MATVLGAAARAVLQKIGGKAVKGVARVIGVGKKVATNPAARTAGGVAVTVGATAAGTRVARKGEGSGTPVVDAEYEAIPKYGLPVEQGGYGMGPAGTVVPGLPVAITKPPRFEARAVADKGYVIVDVGEGKKIQMLKKVAVAMGLRKATRRGGGITAREIKSARKVQRVITALTVKREPRVKISKGKKR